MSPSHPARTARAFTLVEMMVSMSLLAIIAVLLSSMTNQTTSLWNYTTSRIEQFRGAATAFDRMTNRLGQATLNTYWDYDYDNSNPPKVTKYERKSDLRFIMGPAETLAPSGIKRTHAIFFTAPMGYVDDTVDFGGMPNLLNAWGYYLEFNLDPSRPPFLTNLQNPPPNRFRYRLMEFMQPSNALSIFSTQTGNPNNWFLTPLSKTPAPTHVLAENVIALILLPKLSGLDTNSSSTNPESADAQALLTADYTYDSTVDNSKFISNGYTSLNQLPPLVQVTMVAIDEASAIRTSQGPASSTEAEPHLPELDSLVTGSFTTPSIYDNDLAALQDGLQKRRINYRVFTTNVSIRAAKWSPK